MSIQYWGEYTPVVVVPALTSIFDRTPEFFPALPEVELGEIVDRVQSARNSTNPSSVGWECSIAGARIKAVDFRIVVRGHAMHSPSWVKCIKSSAKTKTASASRRLRRRLPLRVYRHIWAFALSHRAVSMAGWRTPF